MSAAPARLRMLHDTENWANCAPLAARARTDAPDSCQTQVPYAPWLPQEHGGEPTAAAAYATAEAAAKARGTNTCGEVRGRAVCVDAAERVMRPVIISAYT